MAFLTEEKKMPVKEWFRQLQPVQLYVILGLTIVFFISELVVSHITHSITLLMDSYHTLCNILALSACMITVKYGKAQPRTISKAVPEEGTEGLNSSSSSVVTRNKQQEKLKNTFGWARIDVIGMLICCVFLASLSFSILVEALQTLIHIDHQDEMHHPIPVFGIATAGLMLNGVCYLIIGGYTFHQGSFLYMTDKGAVVLNRVVTNDSVRRGERRLSRTRTVPPSPSRQRQGVREMFRDIIGCLFVMICSVLVYFTDKDLAKFIDPAIAVISAVCLMVLSFPYTKESCLILLQTIPDTINIDSLKTQLLEHFPDIINIHDLHIWQLTATKVISTAHIIFQNPTVYLNITNSLTEFFQEYGITQVTIQPEFFTKANSCQKLNSSSNSMCLMQCSHEECRNSYCCFETETPPPKPLSIQSNWKSSSKETVISSNSSVDLKSVKFDNSELPILTNETTSEDSNETNDCEATSKEARDCENIKSDTIEDCTEIKEQKTDEKC